MTFPKIGKVGEWHLITTKWGYKSKLPIWLPLTSEKGKFHVTRGSEWDFWLLTRPSLLPFVLGYIGVTASCEASTDIREGEMASLLLGSGESSISPLGLL